MANHSSILAWRIPWTKEPGSRKELDTTEATEHTHARTPRTSPVVQWLRIQLPKDTRQHIKKQRHYFANSGLSSQGYGVKKVEH